MNKKIAFWLVADAARYPRTPLDPASRKHARGNVFTFHG